MYAKYAAARLLEQRYQTRTGIIPAGEHGVAQGRWRCAFPPVVGSALTQSPLNSGAAERQPRACWGTITAGGHDVTEGRRQWGLLRGRLNPFSLGSCVMTRLHAQQQVLHQEWRSLLAGNAPLGRWWCCSALPGLSFSWPRLLDNLSLHPAATRAAVHQLQHHTATSSR